MTLQRGLGWLKDPDDHRDRMASVLLGDDPSGAPVAASISEHVTDILDQQSTNSCVGQSVAQAIRTALRVQGVQDPPLPSRRFIYGAARAWHGDADKDEGTYIRAAFSTIHKLGFPRESALPWDQSKINEDVTSISTVMAAADQAGTLESYFRVPTVGQSKINYIRQAIAEGHPVVFGTTLDDAFFDHDGATPYVRLGPSIGGHALCGTEYNSEGLVGPNSWGTGWGAGGWYIMSWEQLARDEVSDVWIVKTAPRYSARRGGGAS